MIESTKKTRKRSNVKTATRGARQHSNLHSFKKGRNGNLGQQNRSESFLEKIDSHHYDFTKIFIQKYSSSKAPFLQKKYP